jgi:hypothetical protein
MKKTFVFLLAVALVLPLATAFNCTELNGEEHKFCEYIEDQDWPQKEKDILIQEAIDSNKASLDGDFVSIAGKEVPCIFKLNKPEENPAISDDNKKFLIDFSSISLFGYVIYSFLKKYYLLLHLL